MTDEATIYDFYEQLLNTCSHEVADDGTVMKSLTKDKTAATINGKKLMFPLANLLREKDEDVIFFHPLSEQMTRYESDVFRYLKRAMTLKLIVTMSSLGCALIKLQEEPSIQRKMSLEQINFIKGIDCVDAKSARSQWLAWTRLMTMGISEHPLRMDKWSVNIYLKRNGTFNNKAYRRVAVPSFPVFNELYDNVIFSNSADGKEYFRNKDYPMFRQVVESIFPEIKTGGLAKYSNGYDGILAPYFITFLRTFKLLAEHMNGIFEMFKNELSEIQFDIDAGIIKMPWANMVTDSELSKLEVFKARIPGQSGNIGDLNGKESDEDEDIVDVEPRKVERKPEPEPERKSEVKVTETATKDNTEATELRQRWKKEQDELERDRDDRNRRDDRYDRDRDRDYDDRSRDRDRDDRSRDRDSVKTKEGSVSITSLFNRDPSIIDSSRSADEDRDRGRGRSRGWGRDDRDDRNRRDDRDYDRRDSRDRDRDRDRGRGWGRDDRDDRSYRDDRDRGRGWGRR